MKLVAVLPLIAVTLLPFGPQDKVKIEPKPTVDAQNSYALSVQMTLGEMKADVSVKLTTTVKSVEKDVVTTIGSWQGLKVMLDGEELPMLTASDVKVVSKITGEVQSVEGGVQGSDEARMYLITHFVPPTDSLAPGDKYKIELPGVPAKGIPALKHEGTYEGPAEAGGRKGHRYKVRYTEPTPDGMAADLTFVVMADGTLLKAEGSFTNMPVPQVGTNAAGSYRLEMQK